MRRILIKFPADSPGADGFRRHLGAFSRPGVLSICLYRVSHMLWVRGWRRLARLAAGLNTVMFKSMISPESCVDGGWFLPHPAGVTFDASAGRGFTLYALSTCGSTKPHDGNWDAPRFGDDVTVGVHATIQGPVSIGDRARIGFRVNLSDHVPMDHLVVSRTMRVAFERRVVVPEATSPGPARLTADDSRMPHRLRDVRSWLREDRQRLKRLRLESGEFLAYGSVWLYRASHYFRARRWNGLARLFWQLNLHLTGADIDPATQVAAGLVIPRPAGVWLHVVGGRNLTIMATACAGPAAAGKAVVPRLADDVILEPQALVYGPVHVAAGARISSGCVVLSDVEAGAIVAPTPTRTRRIVSRTDFPG